MEITVHCPNTTESQTQDSFQEQVNCTEITTQLLSGFTAKTLKAFTVNSDSKKSAYKVWMPVLKAPVVQSVDINNITVARQHVKTTHIDICEDLKEFQPEYLQMCRDDMKSTSVFKKPWTPIGKSCFVTRKMRQRKDKEKDQLSPLVRRMMKNNADRLKTEVDKDSPNRLKRKWCASSCVSSNNMKTRRRSGMSSVTKSRKIRPLKRGKWIIKVSEDDSVLVWKSICNLVSQGQLQHCNAKLEGDKEIWLYCNFCQAKEVRDVLKEEKIRVSSMEFFVPGIGVVLRR